MDCRLLLFPTAVLAVGCPADENIDGATDTTEASSGTSAQADSSGTAEAGDSTGDAPEVCPAGNLAVGLVVESAALEGLGEETSDDSFQLACTVDALTDSGSELELTCAGAPDQEDTAWTVTIDGPQGFSLPLDVGDAVEMVFMISRGFEVGSTRKLRLSVDGESILFAYSSSLDGGLIGLCGPGEENGEDDVEGFLGALGLGVSRGTCEPIDALRLDFDVDGETASIYGGEQAAVGGSGWSVAAGSARCVSQEDDPEITGSDNWDVSVVAWRS